MMVCLDFAKNKQCMTSTGLLKVGKPFNLKVVPSFKGGPQVPNDLNFFCKVGH